MDDELRKALIDWSRANSPDFTDEQLQAFLFFYECFSILDNRAETQAP